MVTNRRNSLDLIAQYYNHLNIQALTEESSPSSSDGPTVAVRDSPKNVEEAMMQCKSDCAVYNRALQGAQEWEAAHDELLRTWRRQASINLWLQSASAYYYERLNNLVTYPAILVSAVTSVGMFASENEIMRYVLAGLSMFSACITALSRQMRAAEKAQEYTIKARELGKFVRYLNFLLTLEMKQRPSVQEAITTLRIDFDRINDTQLEPPLNIVRLYERNHKSLESTLYEELEELKLRKSKSTEQV